MKRASSRASDRPTRRPDAGGAALLAAAAALLLVSLALSPDPALAQTAENSWQISSTIELDVTDEDDLEATVNLERCRELAADADASVDFTFNLVDGVTPLSGSRYSIKHAYGNEPCDTTDLSEVATDECTTLIEDDDLTAQVFPFTQVLDFIDVAGVTEADACDALSPGLTSYVYVIVSQPNLATGEDTIYDVTYRVVFQTTRPTTPGGVSATGGESSINVTWEEVADTSIDGYYIYYSTSELSAGTPPEDLSGASRRLVRSGSSGTVTGVNVGQSYFVAVASVDEDDNLSLLSASASVTTAPVDDFWEAYSRENNVDSGFCFIATAAYGSYQEPHVQVLRDLRDRYLLTNAPGRLFVEVYYATSPPLADWIARHDTARAIARALLWPLYALAIMLLYSGPLGKLGLLLALLMSGGLSVRLGRRWRARRRARRLTVSPVRGRAARLARVSAAAALLIACAAWTSHAHGQSLDRQESPVDTMLEFKGGPYAPSNLGDTYEQFFGDDGAVLLELEYDWQFYRGIGSLGIGGSIGYASVSGQGLNADGTPSVDSTELSWLPLRLQLIYRFDWLAHRLGVPLVPYVKVGLDYYIWWVNNGSGDTATNETGDAGSGATPGWHVIGGLALLLDWFAPSMATGFDLEWGVNNSYLFVEILYADISGLGFSDKLDLSDTTFLIGLGLEF